MKRTIASLIAGVCAIAQANQPSPDLIDRVLVIDSAHYRVHFTQGDTATYDYAVLENGKFTKRAQIIWTVEAVTEGEATLSRIVEVSNFPDARQICLYHLDPHTGLRLSGKVSSCHGEGVSEWQETLKGRYVESADYFLEYAGYDCHFLRGYLDSYGSAFGTCTNSSIPIFGHVANQFWGFDPRGEKIHWLRFLVSYKWADGKSHPSFSEVK